MPFFVFFSTVFTDVGTAFTMSDTPPRVDTPPPDVEPIADDEYSPPPRDGPSDAAAAGVAGATGERPPKASRSASSPQNCAHFYLTGLAEPSSSPSPTASRKPRRCGDLR